MSQITKPGTGGGGGGGIIQTIAGDIGSITGANVTIFADVAALNSGQTVEFDNSGTVSTLNVTDNVGNTIIGKNSGSSGVGLKGAQNTAIGSGNFGQMNLGEWNVACGVGILPSCTNGGGNIGIAGLGALGNLTTGSNNIAIGFQEVLDLIITGENNIAIGQGSGHHYTSSESDNILINNQGVIGESNVIRVGTQGSGAGQQNKSFMVGITGVTVAASSPVAVDTNGQLSDLGFGTATQVLTSNGPGVSPSWQAAGGGGTPSVAFMGFLNATASAVIGGGIPWTMVGLTSSFDVGSNLNAATGVFTAPTTGEYYLGVTVNVTNFGATNTDLDVAIICSGGLNLQPINNYNPFVMGTGNLGLEGGSLIHMTAGDTAHVEIDASGSAYDVFGTGSNAYTNFYGYKIESSSGSGFTPVNWSVQLSANQANVTGNNTQYQIPYDSVLFDSATGYNAGTFLYTIPTTGIYNITLNTFLFGGGASSSLFFSWLSINGAAFPGLRIADLDPSSLGLTQNNEFILSFSTVRSFTAGDTIGIFIDVIGGAGNDVGVGGGAVGGCLFSGYRVG